jgi:hypothetical protein
MTVIGTKTGVHGELRMELERLESLVADLRHLANGHRPSPRNLDTAPMLDNWEQGVRPDPCLIGTMAGHPYCRGRMSVTSGLWVLSPELGWVRTLNRF